MELVQQEIMNVWIRYGYGYGKCIRIEDIRYQRKSKSKVVRQPVTDAEATLTKISVRTAIPTPSELRE